MSRQNPKSVHAASGNTLPPQVEKFKYLGMLFTRDGKQNIEFGWKRLEKQHTVGKATRHRVSFTAPPWS